MEYRECGLEGAGSRGKMSSGIPHPVKGFGWQKARAGPSKEQV